MFSAKLPIQPILLLLIPIVFISCDTVIDLDLPEEEKKLVVNSFFTADEPLQLQVSSSLGAMDMEEPKPVDDAVVTLFKEDEPVDTLSPKPPADGHAQTSRYISENYIPESGNTYRIEVQADGFERASAVTRLPEPPQSLTLKEFTENDIDAIGSEWHRVLLSLQIRPDSYYTITPVVEFYNEFYEDSTLAAPDYLTPAPQLSHAGAGEFDQIMDTGVLLSGETELELQEDDHDQIDLKIYPEVVHTHNPYASNSDYYINIRKVTADYAEYIRSLRVQDLHRDNPFAERVSVYSNVENGYGIVSGYQETQKLLE